LADNLARWGAVNVLVTHETPERLAATFGPVFDRVLIDAPCSGEAMFRRLESVEWSAAIVTRLCPATARRAGRGPRPGAARRPVPLCDLRLLTGGE
jgi:hypothetical protein